ALMTHPSPAFGHPLPAARARGNKKFPFSPPRGEKAPEGRMRGASLEAGNGDCMKKMRWLAVAAVLVVESAFAPVNADKPVEETKKNIKVLKGMPTSQLIPVMAFMSNSLGVTCAHCHTKEWESDEIEAKDAARGMIAMVRDINERHFAGEQAITCNSCHQGHVR